MDEPAETAYSVPPVHRAIAVLQYIADGNRCQNTSTSARALGINRTTLMRLLHTLTDERMIQLLDGGGGYQLGTRLVSLAAHALNDLNIVQIARPVLRKLAEKLSLSAHLGVLERTEIVYLAREAPNSHLVSNVREGTRLPAHATTIGRILLGQMDGEALARLYAGFEFPAATVKTRTSLASLTEQIASDRNDGIAWSVSNFETGIGSAAVAVHDHRGDAVAAINVTGHESQFEPGSAKAVLIETELKAAARAISTALGHRG